MVNENARKFGLSRADGSDGEYGASFPAIGINCLDGGGGHVNLPGNVTT
jgi:hypothetical protein